MFGVMTANGTEAGTGRFRSAVRADRIFFGCVALQIATFFPVWRWYVARITDPSDEPWGLVALMTALYLAAQEVQRSRHRIEPRRFVPPLPALVFGVLYSATYPFTPPLVHGIFAALALGSVVCQRLYDKPWHPGLWGLLFLSLPLIPTLQFYLGFPLRALTAWIAAHLLALGGITVTSTGTMLEFQNQSVWLDAPCSGVKMMWTAGYLTCTLSMLLRLSATGAFRLSALTPLIVLAANIARACFLFILETELSPYSPLLHTAIGVLSFVTAGIEILLAALFIKSCERCPRPRRIREKFSPARAITFAAVQLLCCSAAFVPEPADGAPVSFAPDWPTTFDGQQLIELPISSREQAFEADFPGKLKRYQTDSRELIVRIVAAPTRKLHPAEHCLKGVGYKLTPLPARVLGGRTWGCSKATKPTSKLTVCENIQDASGNSYPDVSSWYWAALLRRSTGPWIALTFSEAAD